MDLYKHEMVPTKKVKPMIIKERNVAVSIDFSFLNRNIKTTLQKDHYNAPSFLFSVTTAIQFSHI